MEDYKKAPLTYEQQIALLQSRGLIINSVDDSIIFLQQVNYYRFSAYCIPFQNPHDCFIPGITFDNLVELYGLDEELRNNLLALISPIEVFLKTRIVYELSHQKGPFAHYDTSVFWNQDQYQKWIAYLEDEVNRGKETFLDHYKNKYNGFPRLPLWMACEIMSMGCLSELYNNLLLCYQDQISSVFEVRAKILESWMHVITYLRNTCAHQGRLWNRGLTIRPLIPDKDPRWIAQGLKNTRIFASIAVLEWICRKASLPVAPVESVYDVIHRIAAIDPRFAGMMGVPAGRAIGMCWEGIA